MNTFKGKVARVTAAGGTMGRAAYVRTPKVTGHLDDAHREALLQQIAVGCLCEPGAFARVVCFLASPLSGFITGEVIDLNGGLLMD